MHPPIQLKDHLIIISSLLYWLKKSLYSNFPDFNISAKHNKFSTFIAPPFTPVLSAIYCKFFLNPLINLEDIKR